MGISRACRDLLLRRRLHNACCASITAQTAERNYFSGVLGGRPHHKSGNSPYHAAKWAVSGFSEALAQETKSFGVQICSLEPGGIRTNWGKSAAAGIPPILEDYEESVGKTLGRLHEYWGNENSDPQRIAKAIVKLSDERSLPPHLLLGSDAVANLERADEQRRQAMSSWRDVSVSVDYRPGN